MFKRKSLAMAVAMCIGPISISHAGDSDQVAEFEETPDSQVEIKEVEEE